MSEITKYANGQQQKQQTLELQRLRIEYEKLYAIYDTILPKVNPDLINDLLLRQQKNPAVIPTYIVEVFTKQGIDSDEAKEYVYKKTGMVPAVYDKGTHYVTNQRLSLEILKEISDCEDVVGVAGQYVGSSASVGACYEPRSYRNYICYY